MRYHCPFLASLVLCSLAQLQPAHSAEDDLLLGDDVIPWQDIGRDFTERPAPVTEVIEDLIFETNRNRRELIAEQNRTGQDLDPPQRKTIFGRNPFLGSGEINPGFETPTGAVWQPALIIYGTARSALQTYSNGNEDISEWANRLDLFSNLYLTPTERILLGIRPLDSGGEFAGYRFDGPNGSQGGFNGRIRTLFFEGDFGELFPNLDPQDTKSLDYGFAIGRMPYSLQDGDRKSVV